MNLLSREVTSSLSREERKNGITKNYYLKPRYSEVNFRIKHRSVWNYVWTNSKKEPLILLSSLMSAMVMILPSFMSRRA
jgi:hypothetical protein